ncbi:hypothetical protein COCVIDRAFT_19233 [Bipolaris victoriae FI3]|uniref:Uncharacterized protein n=1 Tax=Bipolaris victoriae (strain FI3) TaxID=930091 RepID=W7EB23_BIPV3|nr:hypothetical protein COCVIDRAFT_19233 [Bipolaris victoriae FI3]
MYGTVVNNDGSEYVARVMEPHPHLYHVLSRYQHLPDTVVWKFCTSVAQLKNPATGESIAYSQAHETEVICNCVAKYPMPVQVTNEVGRIVIACPCGVLASVLAVLFGKMLVKGGPTVHAISILGGVSRY